jgi:hypothetical protein
MSRELEVPGGAEHFLTALAQAHARGRARSRVRDDRRATEPRTDQALRGTPRQLPDPSSNLTIAQVSRSP